MSRRCGAILTPFEARKFSIIAPQGMGQGTMEVLVDGKHEIQLKNKNGMVAIDAIIIQ